MACRSTSVGFDHNMTCRDVPVGYARKMMVRSTSGVSFHTTRFRSTSGESGTFDDGMMQTHTKELKNSKNKYLITIIKMSLFVNLDTDSTSICRSDFFKFLRSLMNIYHI